MQSSVSDIPAASEIELTDSQYAVIELAESFSHSNGPMNIEIVRQLESSFLAADAAGNSLEVRRNCKSAFIQFTPVAELPKMQSNPNWYFPSVRYATVIISVSLSSVIFKNQFYGFLSAVMRPLSDIFGYSSFMC